MGLISRDKKGLTLIIFKFVELWLVSRMDEAEIPTQRQTREQEFVL